MFAVAAQNREAGVRESFPEKGLVELSFKGCGISWVKKGQDVPGRRRIIEELNHRSVQITAVHQWTEIKV